MVKLWTVIKWATRGMRPQSHPPRGVPAILPVGHAHETATEVDREGRPGAKPIVVRKAI